MPKDRDSRIDRHKSRINAVPSYIYILTKQHHVCTQALIVLSNLLAHKLNRKFSVTPTAVARAWPDNHKPLARKQPLCFATRQTSSQ